MAPTQTTNHSTPIPNPALTSRAMPRVSFLVVLLAACGSEGSPPEAFPRPDADVLRFDAAMLETPPPDRDAAMPPPRDAGPRDAGPLDAGTSGATDLRYFVPPIPITYAGTLADPGVSLTSWTMIDDPPVSAFLFAVRNTYGSPLCTINMRFTFVDRLGATVATGSDAADTSAMRGCSGTCGLVPGCLPHGETGLGYAYIDEAPGRTLSEIVSGTFNVGALNLIDAVPTSELPVRGLTAVPGRFEGLRRLVGSVNNLGRATVRNPDVAIYGVNAVGRPLFRASDIELITIPPGGTWSFQATPEFEGEYASLVTFVDAAD